MDTIRLFSTTVIGSTGIVLSLIAGQELLSGITGIAGLVIAGATLLLGFAFVSTGPLAYRADIQTEHLLRIAGWNTLGVVATTAVLGLTFTFQAASGGNVAAPLLSSAIIVGVSAFAHVLIGFNDVRRIRAQTVAKQRQKAAVINRFVRHDLKHAAQLLIGYGEHLTDSEATRTDGGIDIGKRIIELAESLSATQSQIVIVDELLESDYELHPVKIEPLIQEQITTLQQRYPTANVVTDLSAAHPVLAGEHVQIAFQELLENAFIYADETPEVVVTSSRSGSTVKIVINDNGDGFPEEELSLINDDATETQLKHSDGLGLWLSKWIIETYEGTLKLQNNTDEQGSTVTIELPTAA